MRTETRNIQWSSVASRVSETAVDRVAREEVTAARWEANSFKLLQLYKIEARKSSPGYRERPRDHVPVDADRVLHPHRVSARQERGRRDAARGARSEHDVVSPAQVFAAQLQSAELVLLEGVRSRDVGDEIRAVPAQDRGRLPPGKDAAPRAQEGGLDELLRVGKLQDRLLEHGEPPLDELVHVGAIVHAKHLLEARASRLEDLGVGEKPSPHDFLANEAEFPGREDVPADVREITVGMDDRRRGHGTLFEGSAGR